MARPKKAGGSLGTHTHVEVLPDLEARRETPSHPETAETAVERKIQGMLHAAYEYFVKTGEVDVPGLAGPELHSIDIEDRWHIFFEEKEDLEGLYTPEKRRNATLFFEKFIQQIQQLRRNGDNPESIERYAAWWHQHAFSVSPNLFNRLELEDEFVFSSMMYGLPETRYSMGENHVGELVYNLEFSGGEYTWLDDILKSQSLERQIDVLHFIENIARYSLGTGYSERVMPKLRRALKNKLEQTDLNPLERYATETTLGHMNLDVLRDGGEIEDGDVAVDARKAFQRVRTESAGWHQRLSFDREPETHAPLARISRDYIAAYDSGRGTPETLARIPGDGESLRASTVDRGALVSFERTLNSPAMRFSKREKRKALQAMLSRLISPTESKEHVLARIFPEIPESGWVSLLPTLSAEMSLGEFEDFRIEELLRRSDFVERLKVFAERVHQAHPIPEVHADLFERFEDNRSILPRGSKQRIDSALLLKELHRPEIQGRISHDLGMDLRSLSLREQIHLLSFMLTADAATYEKTTQMIHEVGEDAAVSFLSCESDPKMAETILQIGEKAPEALRAQVFQKYAELARLAEQTTDEMRAVVGTKDVVFDAESVSKTLLERGKQLFVRVAKSLDADASKAAIEALAAEFERLKSDILLFAAVVKDASRAGEVEFKEWKGVSIESVDPQQLKNEERRQLLHRCKEVLWSNWADKGISASEIALHGLEEGFAAKEQRTHVHLLKRNDEVIAFLRFDERPDLGPRAVYAGSFNVDPSIRGSAIGSAFFHEVLKREGQKHDIHAHVFADDRVGMNYVENFGFVITGVETEEKEGEKTEWFAIRRDESLNDELQPTSGTRDQTAAFRFEWPQDRERMLAWVRQQTAEGKVINRYRRVGKKDEDVRELRTVEVTKPQRQKTTP